ncbi:hypothetical protein FLL45_06160 [Aliikangiella marina]|uniref:DUF3574 domain-containing protein n=1 Tax=Aliikangiella marina TaxID=1712262 RepID=A0A545TJW9_9GAMM|nr:hypothetical protein [Aliikangiella marina]TQV77524.1 hypothetical protein FLL45_06160 [Aliikangiella marina]
MRLLLFVLFLSYSVTGFAKKPEHADVSTDKNQNMIIWSETADSWLTVESFWQEYAKQKGGLTWGQGSDYPEYSQVKERDTFMVELEQGPCLMEFFHERWRRANDVIRWNEKLNEYGGCPFVFD